MTLEEHICRFSSPHETKKGMKALTSKAMEWFTGKKENSCILQRYFCYGQVGKLSWKLCTNLLVCSFCPGKFILEVMYKPVSL